MTEAQLAAETLLDTDLALSLWGDDALYQRLLRQSLRGLESLPNLDALPACGRDEQLAAAGVLHKHAGRSGSVGLNRLAAALRLADGAIRQNQPMVEPLSLLRDVVGESLQAGRDYLAANEVPYLKAEDPAKVDRGELVRLLNTLEASARGEASTSAQDDAIEELADLIGEDPAWPAVDAVNRSDNALLLSACAELRDAFGL